jgi:hypothetical protein
VQADEDWISLRPQRLAAPGCLAALAAIADSWEGSPLSETQEIAAPSSLIGLSRPFEKDYKAQFPLRQLCIYFEIARPKTTVLKDSLNTSKSSFGVTLEDPGLI